jgi:hypothetical protein
VAIGRKRGDPPRIGCNVGIGMGNHRSWTATWGASCLVLALAATGCPTVELGDTPEDIGLCNPRGGLPYFQDVIWPRYVRPGVATSCASPNTCHVLGDGNLLGYKIDDPIDFPANYRATLVHLQCGAPMMSKFLTKPLMGIEGHSGGDIFQMGSAEVQLFLDWFK